MNRLQELESKKLQMKFKFLKQNQKVPVSARFGAVKSVVVQKNKLSFQ